MRIRLSLSLVNYAEALVLPGKDPQTLRAAANSITALGIELVTPTPAITREAARFRQPTTDQPRSEPPGQNS